MLLDPRPGSLTGSSHVTSPSFVCSSGANVLAEKGLAGASTRDRNTPKPCPPCAPRGNHLWSFTVSHAEPKPLLRGSAMPIHPEKHGEGGGVVFVLTSQPQGGQQPAGGAGHGIFWGYGGLGQVVEEAPECGVAEGGVVAGM